MSIQTVRKLLPKLSTEELREVRMKCSALLGNDASIEAAKARPKLERPDEDDWYARAVGRYAVSKGWVPKEQVPIYLSQKGLLHLPHYRESSRNMRRHVELMLRGKFRQDELDAIGDVIVQSVALRVRATNNWLKTEGKSTIPLDGHLLLNRVDRALEALEEQLPGYLANGMLRLVIKSRGDEHVGQVEQDTRVRSGAIRRKLADGAAGNPSLQHKGRHKRRAASAR